MSQKQDAVELVLVGCGMMGLRHVRGYAELERVNPGSLHLRAVCDTRAESAERAASEAEDLLGYRPNSYRDIETCLTSEKCLEAGDVVTTVRTHDSLSTLLMDAGLDVVVEKPMALTTKRCKSMVEKARRTGRILALAENNPFDPMNRLLREVIRSGLIGEPQFVLQLSVTSGRGVLASEWRHSLASGGLALDIGIHQGYIIESLLGAVEAIYATSRQVWSHRKTADGREVPVKSEDLFSAVLSFECGAQGIWVLHFGATGRSIFERKIFGRTATAEGPPDRSGKPVRVYLEGGVLEGEELLRVLPEFCLSGIEALLSGERPPSCELTSNDMDRKLIACELADFISAVLTRQEPEVPGELGLRSVALIYTLLESSHSGKPLRLEDVLSGRVSEYQAMIDPNA